MSLMWLCKKKGTNLKMNYIILPSFPNIIAILTCNTFYCSSFYIYQYMFGPMRPSSGGHFLSCSIVTLLDTESHVGCVAHPNKICLKVHKIRKILDVYFQCAHMCMLFMFFLVCVTPSQWIPNSACTDCWEGQATTCSSACNNVTTEQLKKCPPENGLIGRNM
jgi:hypothetical protein